MEKYINLPLNEEKVRDIKAGDYVYLTGELYTARDAAHKRMTEEYEQTGKYPFDITDQTIYYLGPSPAREGQIIGSAGPTTSTRMDKYTPKLLDNGLKGMIGKGKRSTDVINSMAKNTAVYFAAVGGAGALLSKCIKESTVIAYEDLGTEAIRKLWVENLPVIAVIDCNKNNMYERDSERSSIMSFDMNSYNNRREELVSGCAYAGEELNEKELMVNENLLSMKKDYLASYKGPVPYEMNVLTDDKIWDSKLYKMFKDMPKGSDLHVHGGALMPGAELVEFMKKNNKLFVCVSEGKRGCLMPADKAKEETEEYKSVSRAIADGDFTEEELVKIWTLAGNPEGSDVWEYMEMLFAYHGDICTEITEDYYVEAFTYYCENNIFHLEVKPLLFGSNEDAMRTAGNIRKAYYTVKKNYPELIVSLVGAGLKLVTLPPTVCEMLLTNSLYVHENLKDDFDPAHVRDFLIGIDLVNEEDKSNPLGQYAERIAKAKEEHPNIHIYLHAGETLYASSDNIVDAYLMGAERIGHGLNLYRYPKVKEMIKKDKIVLEVCPISNQILEYVKDLRLHPAAGYLKEGVEIVLCSDDPAYEEHTTLTDDFFAACVCWDLGLAEIKRLCINSIRYSGLGEDDKAEVMGIWEKKWAEFTEKYAY